MINKGRQLWRRHSLWRLSLSITLMMWLAVAIALFSIYYLSIQPLIKSQHQLINQHVLFIQTTQAANPTAPLQTLLENSLYNPQGIFTALQGHDGQMYGSLNSFPPSLPICPQLISFPIFSEMSGDITLLDGCQFSVQNYQVLVATDNEYLWQIRDNFLNATIAVLIGTFFIALIPSWIIRRKMTSHLSSIHQVVSQIEKGRFDGRLTLNGTRDEWDTISGYINAMLDEIESSISQIKGVTDAIAHDLRTPLTRIKNRLSQLEAQWPQQHSISIEHLQLVQTEFDDLLVTFNAMLELSKLEALHDTQHFKTLDLATIVNDAVELVEPQLEEKQQSLLLNIEPCQVVGEPSLLFRMVYNLLDNAHKYSPKHSTISVSLTKHMLTISDNGPGIAPQYRQKVFQRLYRTDSSRTTQGHGLGLALVSIVAKLHGANIQLNYTDAENQQGLTISIQLP
jgi:signal transduction histidine kinase